LYFRKKPGTLKIKLTLAFLLLLFVCFSQEEILTIKIPNGELEGTLLLPEQKSNIPVVIIIAGSGPTDRNGNQEDLENNSLKMIALELKKNGIASFRFDKRGVGQSTQYYMDEAELRFETYLNDIKNWIDLLAKDKRFNRIIVAGHSEGSLLGMLASLKNKNVSAYISLAGAGRPIDEILKEQLSRVPDEIKTNIYSIIDKLKNGDTLGNIPKAFYGLFRPSIQPYLRSWMMYDPQKEIANLKIPILIVNGTTDIQVPETNAILLANAQPKAQLSVIKNMNHVLKDCDTTERKVQDSVYTNPDLPLNKEFVNVMIDFLMMKAVTGPSFKVKN
jgi:pimeloyl-ACP methyl ester carboxylesterase